MGGKGYNQNGEEAQTTLGGGRRNAQLLHHQEKSSSDLCPKSLFSGASGKRTLEGAILRPEQRTEILEPPSVVGWGVGVDSLIGSSRSWLFQPRYSN